MRAAVAPAERGDTQGQPAPRACVWMGLNAPSALYSASKPLLRSALTGSGCRSSSSVGGGKRSGSSSCLRGAGHGGARMHASPAIISTCRRQALQRHGSLGCAGRCASHVLQAASSFSAPEVDRQRRLAAEPAVADELDEIRRRQRLAHGHREGQPLLLLGERLAQQPVLVVQQHLARQARAVRRHSGASWAGSSAARRDVMCKRNAQVQ